MGTLAHLEKMGRELKCPIWCGVLTVEIEHVDVEILEKLEQQGVDCQPKASTIRIIQVGIVGVVGDTLGNGGSNRRRGRPDIGGSDRRGGRHDSGGYTKEYLTQS